MKGLSSEPVIPVDSFSFRFACYDAFGWDYDQVSKLPEPEAIRLAIVFEEQQREQYKQQKEAAKSTREAHTDGYSEPGFVTDFTFGDDDDQDYSDTTLIED